jgi:hypothetical protein
VRAGDCPAPLPSLEGQRGDGRGAQDGFSSSDTRESPARARSEIAHHQERSQPGVAASTRRRAASSSPAPNAPCSASHSATAARPSPMRNERRAASVNQAEMLIFFLRAARTTRAVHVRIHRDGELSSRSSAGHVETILHYRSSMVCNRHCAEPSRNFPCASPRWRLVRRQRHLDLQIVAVCRFIQKRSEVPK